MRQLHHGKGGSHHCGRLRIAAAKILTTSLGFTVYPEDIKPATGSYRTDWQHDVYRWELFAHDGSMPVVAGCWETLGDFVRESKRLGGCQIHEDIIRSGPLKNPPI